MVAIGSGRLLERSLGFVARSVFWLGLVYSAMPFDGSGGPVALPGPLAACVHGMSDDCRSAVERLGLAADVAALSVQAGDALRKAATAPIRQMSRGRRTRPGRRGALRFSPSTAVSLWPLAPDAYICHSPPPEGLCVHVRVDPRRFRPARRVGGSVSLCDRARPRASSR